MSSHWVVVHGFLGRDPELHYLENGTPVCNFSVASTRKWKAEDGEGGEETTWFKVSAWGRLGEVCSEFLGKGRAVLIRGTLKPDESGNPRIWFRDDGTPGASFEITAQSVDFGSRNDHNDNE